MELLLEQYKNVIIPVLSVFAVLVLLKLCGGHFSELAECLFERIFYR